MSSHPDPGEREENIPRMAAEWEDKGYEMELINRRQFLNQIEGLMYGDNPREGFVESGMFYHPDLRFQFRIPNGFELLNKSNAVILFNESQDAITQFTIDNRNNSPRSSVIEFTSQEEIEIIEEGEQNINGFEAYSATVAAVTNDSIELTININAVSFEDNIYRFLNYTTTSQYQTYESVFSQITQSFDGVYDPQVLSVQPVRINLERVRQSGTFSELLPQILPMSIEPLDVAILNQVELDDQIQRGTILKIPVQ